MNKLAAFLLGASAAVVAALPATAQTMLGSELYCLNQQSEVGQAAPTGSVLPFGAPGSNSYLCRRQMLLSPGGFFGTSLNQNNGGILITRGGDVQDVLFWGPGVYYQENTSYYLVLEHPSPTQLRLRSFGTRQPGYYPQNVDIWDSGPISITNGAFAFLRLTDDGVLEVREGTPAKVGNQLWAVQANDPIISFELHGFDYMVDQFDVSQAQPVAGTSQRCINNAPTSQPCALTLTLSFAESHSFAFAFKQGLKVTTKFQGGINLPFLKAATDTSVEVAFETMETWTDTKTKTTTHTSTVTTTTPGNTIYRAQIIAAQVTGTLPYTMSGLATYKSGRQKLIQKSPGTWTGVQAFNFDVVIDCVSSPTNCAGATSQQFPLQPAPGSAVLMPSN